MNQTGVATEEPVDWDRLRVPDPRSLDKVQELCDLTTPYAASPELDALFEEGMVPVGTLPGFGFARPLILNRLAPQNFDLAKLQISCPHGLQLREAISTWLAPMTHS